MGMVVSQSALLMMRAGLLRTSKSRNCVNCGLICSRFAAIRSLLCNWRSWLLPLGSPIRPVPPPANTIGLCPKRCSRANPISASRFPICRLSDVGSKPM